MGREQTNKVLAIYKMLLNDSNIKILRELKKGSKYILELEESIGLDRSTIKRRLYVLSDLGMVASETRKTPRGGNAVYYWLKNIELPSLRLYDILDASDIDEIREMSRIYRY